MVPFPDRPKEVVRAGWDRVSEIYRPEGEWHDAFGHGVEEYRAWIAPLLERLPEGSRVLDLGCGCGIPVSKMLSARFAVTGVDLSDVQVARARVLVPGATFLRADMGEVEFPARAFLAVIALYSMIHLPLPEQRPLLRRIRRWLSTNGELLLIAGHDAYEGTEENWLGSGATMYWSHADAATYRDWLEGEGFEVEEERFIPEGDGGHELFRARAV